MVVAALGSPTFYLFGSMSECDSGGGVISEWSVRETARGEEIEDRR